MLNGLTFLSFTTQRGRVRSLVLVADLPLVDAGFGGWVLAAEP